jgi:hypothetical protein
MRVEEHEKDRLKGEMKDILIWGGGGESILHC